MASALRSIQTARRLLIPRQVQRLLAFQAEKRSDGKGPSMQKRQLCIRQALCWSLETESIEALSAQLLQAKQQAHLEEAHRWFGWVVNYAESGQLIGPTAAEPILVARQVLELGDWNMNRSRRASALADALPPLPECLDPSQAIRRADH